MTISPATQELLEAAARRGVSDDPTLLTRSKVRLLQNTSKKTEARARRSHLAETPRCAAVRDVSRHERPDLRAQSKCLSAFRFMLSKRADAALASLGVTFNFDNV
jgi:hypothetical protein